MYTPKYNIKMYVLNGIFILYLNPNIKFTIAYKYNYIHTTKKQYNESNSNLNKLYYTNIF